MRMINNDTKLSKSPKILSSKIDDEIILLSIKGSAYLGLNDIASRIWEILDEEISFGCLIETLTSEYNIDTETCERETKELINSLWSEEVIILK